MDAWDQRAVDLFKRNAGPVSITVAERQNLAEALSYALGLGRTNEPGEPPPYGPAGAGAFRAKPPPTFAAPGWPPEVFSALKSKAEEMGFKVLTENLRACPDGLDLAFTRADLALAGTATCVLKCPGEDLRLATMFCRTHVLALPKFRVIPDIGRTEAFLSEGLAEEAMYIAFISGPSRTADIERVLTLGVHGPLEMHVVLIDEDWAGRIKCQTPGV